MSGVVWLVVLLLLLLATAVGSSLYFMWLYFRIRARGYRSPLIVLAVAIPPFAAFFGGLILYFTSDPLMNTNSQTFDSGLIGSSLAACALYVGGLSVAVAAAAGGVVTMLPRRQARSFGARRVTFPWRLSGHLLTSVAVLLISLEWVFGVEGIQSFRVAVQLLLPAILYCFYMAGRARAADLNAATQVDPRPPVLYLRAFNREADMFADVGLKNISKYTTQVLNRSAVTFEQYFAKAINEAIGPFVALGSPEDYLPPEGAARAYADDQGWMEQFAALSSRAACVLMEVDDSSNLRWELEHLRRAGLQQKLFVLTRPREMRGWKNVRIMIGRRVYRLLARLKGLRPVSWAAFRAATHPLGYSFPDADPGCGAVIAVDEDGNGVVVARDAVLPQDYLAPIASYLVTT